MDVVATPRERGAFWLRAALRCIAGGTSWSAATAFGASSFLVPSLLVSSLLFPSLSWAADAAPAAGPLGGTPYEFISGTVQFFLMSFFVYFLLVLRPQQIKDDDQARFLKDLKKDDEVLTSGGLFGKVSSIGDGFVVVEVANGVKIRVHPLHINSPASSPVKSAAPAKDSSAKSGPVKLK